MEPRHIPGFYYDPDRKKYFKIQANHVAPAGAKYSRENVKKTEEESRKRKRSADIAATQRQQLVQRNRVLHHPLAGIVAERETGHQTPGSRRDVQARAYASGAEARVCFRSESLHKGPSSGWREGENLTFLDFDPATQGLFCAADNPRHRTGPTQSGLLYVPLEALEVKGTLTTGGLRDDISFIERLSSTRNQIEPLIALEGATSQSPLSRAPSLLSTYPDTFDVSLIDFFQSEITSVSLSQAHHTLLTTSSGSAGNPEIYLTRLQEVDGTHQPRFAEAVRFQTSVHTTIFTAAANPWHGSQITFAFGSSEGVTTMYPDTRPVHHGWTGKKIDETKSDVLALDWLSPHLLAAGLRNASVMLYDTRSTGSALRLRHNGAITALHRADDETRLVICGFPDALCTYDLRMSRELAAPQTSEASKGKRGRHKLKAPPTVPLLRFDYSNKYRYPLGFDVNAEVGLVAAAEDNGRIQLYSLQSGKKVENVPEVQETSAEPHQIKCLRIVETGDRGTKVLAGVGARIVELAW
ncbi:hypothetical protein H2201_003815 [Coniosporium apollinis]|uniref:Myocyte-specific enhancer factor 2d n=1 Tax=Coniosporium apollinis TaxID=61459 RepID=A0ABQ9NUR0_9PEZI|nr:hypothetical protein H2201_003815 [Coniosporium apollinis]